MISFYLFALIYQEANYQYSSFFKFFLRRFLLIVIPIFAFLPYYYLRQLPLLTIYIASFSYHLLYFTTLKQKLKITKRIVRLFILYFYFIFILIIYNIYLVPFALFLLFLSATLLLLPTEKLIGNYYLNKAIRKAKSFKGIRIAITGSYGKTSTKYYTKCLLENYNLVLATPNSYNTPLGISRFINNVAFNFADYLIYEFGARKKGDIEQLSAYFSYDIAIITGIENAHIDTFFSIDEIIREKLLIIDKLPSKGLLLINFENEYLRGRHYNRNIISYGINYGEYQARDIVLSLEGSTFSFYRQDECLKRFKTNLVGYGAINNLLPGLILCFLNGNMPPSVLNISNYENRLSIKRIKDYIIMSDAYNANPYGFKNAVLLLECHKGQKIIITPGYAEMKTIEDSLLAEFVLNLSKSDYVILVENRFTQKASLLLKVPFIIVKSFKEGYYYFLNHHQANACLLIENDFKDL